MSDVQSTLLRRDRWFLVHAQTGNEPLAQLHLQRQSFRTFLPLMWRSIRHARRIRSVTSAFFPGYLFVALDLDADRWRSIDGTIGVVRLVKAGSVPVAAPKGLVEDLIATTNDDGVLDFGRCFQSGDAVRIVHGPFLDQIAQVERLEARDRVRVLLNIMGRSVSAEIRASDLLKV